ncbi:MAG: DUF805 domain-containing protein [Oceanicaulis sp.]
MDAVKSVYSNYVGFQGRARRSEYWWFALFYFIVAVALQLIAVGVNETMGGALYLLFLLGTILPGIAVQVRRLHDTGKSGWWVLLGLIPLIGVIVLIIFYVGDSQPGANKYGPNPKGVDAGPAPAAA